MPYGFIPTLHRIGCGPLIRPPGTFSPLGEKAGMRGHLLHRRRLLQTGQATKASSQRTNFPAAISSLRALNGPCRKVSLRPCTESGRPTHPPSGHLLPLGGEGGDAGASDSPKAAFANRPSNEDIIATNKFPGDNKLGAGVERALPYGFIPTLHRIGCGPLIRPLGTFSPLGEKAGMRGPQPSMATFR